MSTEVDSAAENGREPDGGEEAQPTLWHRFWDQAGTLIVAVTIALTVRAFVIEPFRIPSESMLPTLLIGDHLFVNKFIYGPKIPFTDIRLPGLREPERGDVVVFAVARDPRRDAIYPADKAPDLRRDDFVKRVVGLPGDQVEVRNGSVFINGKAVSARETGEEFRDEHGVALAVADEQLGDCRHAVLDDPGRSSPGQKSMTIPESRYFMMGDNRDHSRDSRSWGTVHLTDFKGPAFILYWSWNRKGNALQFLDPRNWWNAEKRWDRIFQRVRCEPPSEQVAAEGEGAGPPAAG